MIDANNLPISAPYRRFGWLDISPTKTYSEEMVSVQRATIKLWTHVGGC